MKYPENAKNMIDVTKAPYFADNTGMHDCTKALVQAIDDCLADYITSLEEMKKELLALAAKQGGNVYIGAEAGRVVDGEVFITFPEQIPPARILYFPAGTYLVSDTVCYSFDNLHTRQLKTYTCELCRNIHLLGQDRENTVIRLADHCSGFEAGQAKPVISFNRASADDHESTNCAQLNTIADITVDCGEGNPGAIGILYASSNLGRIENVSIRAQQGLYGLKFDYGSEGCVDSVSIAGFDYGIKTGHTSPLVFDRLDLSENKIACVRAKDANLNFKQVNWGNIPAFCFEAGHNGRYYVEDPQIRHIGDSTGNFVFKAQASLVAQPASWPRPARTQDFSKWACVDDFGAVGDGVTDDTVAIQKAMDSGKEVILFGEGCYLISKTVKVPKTVKCIDFMYSLIHPGYSLLIGEMECMFDICEKSEDFLTVEHFGSDEYFAGFYRFFRHSAKRPMLIRDIVVAAALYFNTADDNEVYFDNVFTYTSHYAQDCLHRDGYIPVFCRMIPVELHSQKAYGRNLNIERAEVELLNDNSSVLVDGYKVEGPGKLLKAVNHGKTQLNLFNAAWWGNKLEDNCMFDLDSSEVKLTGGNIFLYAEEKRLRAALCVTANGTQSRTYLEDCSVELSGLDALGRPWGSLIKELAV